jgi:mono/diheme cytochrome c family protein
MIRRLLPLLGLAVVVAGLLVLFSYDVIKIDWVTFMEIQPSYRSMEDPRPVPAGSVPVDGAAFVPGMGAPPNPVAADETSQTRGAMLFGVNCAHCHGPRGQGDGPIGVFFTFKPANLTRPIVQNLSDGALFMVITTGVPNRMPALNENLSVRDRWDVVNYLRTLK